MNPSFVYIRKRFPHYDNLTKKGPRICHKVSFESKFEKEKKEVVLYLPLLKKGLLIMLHELWIFP